MVPAICPCAASYTLTVLSSEAVSRSCESGEKARERTGAEWAVWREMCEGGKRREREIMREKSVFFSLPVSLFLLFRLFSPIFPICNLVHRLVDWHCPYSQSSSYPLHSRSPFSSPSSIIIIIIIFFYFFFICFFFPLFQLLFSPSILCTSLLVAMSNTLMKPWNEPHASSLPSALCEGKEQGE